MEGTHYSLTLTRAAFAVASCLRRSMSPETHRTHSSLLLPEDQHCDRRCEPIPPSESELHPNLRIKFSSVRGIADVSLSVFPWA